MSDKIFRVVTLTDGQVLCVPNDWIHNQGRCRDICVLPPNCPDIAEFYSVEPDFFSWERHSTLSVKTAGSLQEALTLRDMLMKESPLSLKPKQVPCEFDLSTTVVEDSFHEQLLEMQADTNSKNEVFQILPESEINLSTLNQELQDLALRNNITFNCLKEILSLLRRNFSVDVPKDPRTVLKTPRPNVRSIKLVGSGGAYFHIGLADVQARLAAGLKGKVKVFTLKLFFDGMEMAKSMPGSAWPILGVVPESVDDRPFMIGVFYGKKKFTVHDLNDYLGDLVGDLRDLLINGIYVDHEKYVLDPSGPIVCDRPAKSAIKGIVEFHSEYGCDKCDIKGVWIKGRRTYCSSKYTLRTDESFRQRENEDHHIGDCPLEALPINMIDSFVIDFMHQCCLGTQKRLLQFYFGKAPKKSRIPVAKRSVLNSNLERYGKKCPRDFQRRPRSLKHYKKFKATEFRQLMLYTGIVYFKDAFLSDDLYHHFLLFSLSMRVLCCPVMSSNVEILKWAEECIKVFVKESEKFFGKHFVVYNIHSLLHLVNDVRRYGIVDNFTAFPFENYLGKLRKSVRAYHHPLQQLVNRNQEHKSNYTKDQSEISFLNMHDNGPVVPGIRGTQYQRLKTQTFSISVDFLGDNFLKIGNETAQILNVIQGISGTVYLLGKIMLNKRDFFDSPCSSSEFGIFLVDNAFSDLKVTKFDPSTKFHVVVFVDDDKIDYVPSDWISKSSRNNKYYSVWPDTLKNSALVAAIDSCQEVDPRWPKFEIKIKGKADDKGAARAMVNMHRERSSELQQDKEKEKAKMDKIKRKVPEFPGSNPKNSPKRSKLNSSRSLDRSQVRKNLSSSFQISSIGDTSTPKQNKFKNDEKSKENPNNDDDQEELDSTLLLNNSQELDKGAAKEIMGVLNKVMAKQDLILEYINGKKKEEEAALDVQNIVKCHTLDAFYALDKKVLDPTFRNALVTHLRLLGGSNTDKATRNVMNELFESNVASEISWSGTGKVKKHSFCDTHLAIVVKNAVKKMGLKDYTRDECETVIKKWLKGSGDRGAQGKQRREAKRLSEEQAERNNDS